MRTDSYPREKTPEHDGVPVPHKEARYVRDKRRGNDILLKAAGNILKNSKEGPQVRVQLRTGQGKSFEWEPWLGKQIDKGSHGKVFLTRVTKEVKNLTQQAIYKSGSMPDIGTEVAIKLVTASPKEVRGKRLEAAREASWHRALSRAPCSKVPQCSKELCVARHVPKFHWSGMVIDKAYGRHVFIFIMGFVKGTTLNKVVAQQDTKISAQEYVKIERALCSLWWNGVAHADMHRDNILMDTRGEPSVIDFGHAITLPEEIKTKVRKQLVAAMQSNVRSLGEVWSSPKESKYGADVMAYVNRAQHRRELPWYNPDGYMLQQLYSDVTNRQAVPAERRALWGFVEKKAKTPPPPQKPRRKPIAGPLPRGWYELGKPAEPKKKTFTKVAPSEARRESDRLTNRQFMPRAMSEAVKKAAKPVKVRAVARDSGEKNALGRVIMEGPRGGRYIELHGKRRRPAKGRRGANATNNKNAQGRTIMTGPRGGRYILDQGKRRPPAKGRRQAT